jgi:hypothetical protein
MLMVWRRIADMPPGIEHAIVHRHTDRLVEVAGRLRQSWARGAHAPLLGGLIANALPDLALRVGAEKDARRWRTRAGCVPEATVAGPLAWPPLGALDAQSPVPPSGPLPAELPDVPPFAVRPAFEQVQADGCSLDLEATGSLAGLRALVLDVIVPQQQWIYVGLASSAAARVDIGDKPLLRRRVDMGDELAFQVGVATVRPGRVRLVVRVAQQQASRELLPSRNAS